MTEKIKALLKNKKIKKYGIIIARDLLLVLVFAITCFFISRYDNVRMVFTNDGKSYKCDLGEYDKMVITNLINVYKNNGEKVKQDLNNVSDVTVKYHNKTYRVADGLLEEKGLLSRKVYSLSTDEFDNTEVFDSIADKYYPLQAYFTDPDSGFTFITIKKGSNYYRFSSEDDIEYQGKRIVDAFSEIIKPMLDAPAPYDPNGVKGRYIVDFSTKHTSHRMETEDSRIMLDRKFYYTGSEDLKNLLEFLTSQEEYIVEMNYWDYTKIIGY